MNINTPHIVFLTPGFATSEEDSTTIPALQVYLKTLRNALPEIKMTLISFQFPFRKERYDWNGITILPLNGKNKRIKKLWTWKKALKQLKKLHQKHAITCIHSFWIGECSMIGTKFSNKYNIKHLVTVMGQDAQHGNSYAEKLQDTNTTLVTLSKNQQQLLQHNYGLDSKIIPWSLDTSSFPELQETTIAILGVGSLHTVKNYTDFIDIIAVLVKDFPKLKVVIIGEGSERKILEAQIASLELSDHITLLGKQSRPEVLLKMSQATILLHTSTYESFGFVFPEALYSGMQIVSKNVGIATTLPEWTICNTKEAMVTACSSILSRKESTKKRVILYEENACVTSYKFLYNE